MLFSVFGGFLYEIWLCTLKECMLFSVFGGLLYEIWLSTLKECMLFSGAFLSFLCTWKNTRQMLFWGAFLRDFIYALESILNERTEKHLDSWLELIKYDFYLKRMYAVFRGFFEFFHALESIQNEWVEKRLDSWLDSRWWYGWEISMVFRYMVLTFAARSGKIKMFLIFENLIENQV